MTTLPDKQYLRLLDANFNRSREGLRVCEDLCRFVIADRASASKLRTVRHRITEILKSLPIDKFLSSRNVKDDFGKHFDGPSKHRDGYRDLYLANLQRSKESLRVLEETMKVTFPSKAKYFKKLRFDLYEHEKRATHKF